MGPLKRDTAAETVATGIAAGEISAEPPASAADARHCLDDLARLVSGWLWETDPDFKLTFVSGRA